MNFDIIIDQHINLVIIISLKLMYIKSRIFEVCLQLIILYICKIIMSNNIIIFNYIYFDVNNTIHLIKTYDK